MTALIIIAALVAAAVVTVNVVRSHRKRGAFRENAPRAVSKTVQERFRVPLPTPENVSVRALDKIANRAIGTARTKFMPTRVRLELAPEMYERIAPIWVQFSRELGEDLAARAAAESWDYSGVAFSLKANPTLGRRDVEVALQYPDGDDAPTDQVGDVRRRSRGGDDITDVAPGNASQLWFADLPDGRRIALRKGQRYVVGSAATCDVIISSRTVSRVHAALRWHPAAQVVEVEDLDSTNGTWLDNSRIASRQPRAATFDCVIRLGNHDRIRLVKRSATGAAG